ncbi:MAG: alpha/beta fold hydrolase [Acidobacteria bacterium]|nr:alpha/beta fold hydrolase [Acidobacteriota bacterium]
MNTVRFLRLTDLQSADHHAVPAYAFIPDAPHGGAALVHGYGGCKEQMLGIAARLAEEGWAAVAVDVRGHGEHPASLDEGLLQDVEAALTWLRRFGTVVAVGHSLGGRLALLSSADRVIAISPAVASRPSEEGRQMLLAFGSTTVRSPSPGYILELLRKMGETKQPERPVLLLHGDRDIPTLIEGIHRLAGELSQGTVAPITASQHQGTPLMPNILPYLHHWFNHLDLKFNPEVVQRGLDWLRLHSTSRRP